MIEPIWNRVVRRTQYDCPMPENGELILIAYGEGITKPDRCIIKDGEYLLASGRKWSDIDAWQNVSVIQARLHRPHATVSPEINKIAQLYDIFVEATDVDAEYDDAFKLYSPKGLDKFGTKRKKFREKIVNDLELVEPLREIIRDNIPDLYRNVNDNYSLFDDSLLTMAKLISIWYIDLATDEKMRKAGVVLVVRLWELTVLANSDKVRDIWNQYDAEFGSEEPFKIDKEE